MCCSRRRRTPGPRTCTATRRGTQSIRPCTTRYSGTRCRSRRSGIGSPAARTRSPPGIPARSGGAPCSSATRPRTCQTTRTPSCSCGCGTWRSRRRTPLYLRTRSRSCGPCAPCSRAPHRGTSCCHRTPARSRGRRGTPRRCSWRRSPRSPPHTRAFRYPCTTCTRPGTPPPPRPQPSPPPPPPPRRARAQGPSPLRRAMLRAPPRRRRRPSLQWRWRPPRARCRAIRRRPRRPAA
mmetsp:Transcript_14480/g.35827  ORF Transcript_14480/g.35827 Transcript_14480/m.35827 type:complete len:236 (+) Transcript_14480:215-922(+)